MSRSLQIAPGQDWGIHFDQIACPNCEAPLPFLRVPNNVEELLWGGWTCPTCRCRADKWGTPIETRGIRKSRSEDEETPQGRRPKQASRRTR